MICIQKIYGFQGLNHQIIKESWDVTPVTDERTDGGGKWKIVQYSELNQKPQKRTFLLSLYQSDAFFRGHYWKISSTPWPIVVSQRSWLPIWLEEIADMIWKASSMFCNSRPVEWRHADKKQVGCGCDVIEGPRHQLLGKLTNNPVIAKNKYADKQPKDQPKKHLVCS